MTAVDAAVHIAPKVSLQRTAFITFVAVSLPVFGALYWLTAASGRWVAVLVVHLALSIVGALVWRRQQQVFTEVTALDLVGNGIFSPIVRVPRHRIREVRFVDVYDSSSHDTTTQFIAMDAHGTTLFRMRGNFWHPDDLIAVSRALGVEVTVVRNPVSAPEFFARYPGTRYWFEGRPLVTVAAGALTLGIAAAAAVWVVELLM